MDKSVVKIEKQHLEYLDYAKGIGIFFVVLGHALEMPGNVSEFGSVLHRYIYAFHMPLFFMSSGIGLFYKLRDLNTVDLKAEIRRLGERLLLPYLFWCTFYTLLQFVEDLIRGKPNCHMTILERGYAAVTGRIVPLWFLFTLFMVEAAFLWLWCLLKSRKFQTSIYVWGGVLVIAAVLSAECSILFQIINGDGLHLLLRYPLIAAFRFFPCLFSLIVGFVFGIIITKHNVIFQKQTALVIATFSSGTIYWLLEHFSGNQVNTLVFHLDNVWLYFVIGSLGSLTVFFFSMLLPKNIRILRKLGQKSLYLMILHYPPLPTLIVFVMLLDPYSGPIIWLLETFITMFLIYIFIVYVLEPMRNWIFVWLVNHRKIKPTQK